MPLVGVGGTGNTAASGGTAGTGTGLNYVGDFAYAYSGAISIAQSSPEQTMLKFSTGSATIVGTIQASQGSTASTNDMRFTVSFNGEIVGQLLHGGDSQYWGGSFENGMKVIIPPFTEVTVTGYNVSANTGRSSTCSVTGRVYA